MEEKNIEEFMDDFDDLLEKYEIAGVFALSAETEKYDVLQMYRFHEVDGKRILLGAYSKLNVKLCPCCRERDGVD